VKVLLTHERFLPEWGGGGETIVYETARHLMRRGVDVRVLTTGDPAVRVYDGIPTERIPIHRYQMNLSASRIAERAGWADVLQTFNYHACWPSLQAGLRTEKPVVCGFLGLFGDAWVELKGRTLGPLFRSWEKHLVRLPFSRLCFLSEFSRRQAIALGSTETRSRVVCPGVALEAFGPREHKENLVLFVGKFSRRKGVYDVLEVARALPEYRFLMIGWGPEEDALRRLAPSNTTIERGEPGHPPVEAYARARVLLFPSRAETLGLVIPEAMASGCAVVSCVPVDFHGVRVEPGQVPDMIAGVRKLMADEGYFTDCSAANRESSRFYHWERYTDDLLQVYEQALGEPAGKAAAR